MCVPFNGPDDLYAQIGPFVADRIRAGDLALHIIDPAQRSAHLARLGDFGVDVESALRAGQLEVHDWTDYYLADGRFEPRRAQALVHDALQERRARGNSGIRHLTFMEWALEHPGDADAVAGFEALLGPTTGDPRDTLVCAYDVTRHRPGVIADVIAVHPYALVNGSLLTRTLPRDPRERIMATGSRLFHRHGIGGTGIDRVIADAGVAKATFYRLFPSKEDLVIAWLQDPATRWFDDVFRDAEHEPESPERAIASIFDRTAEWLTRDGFRGCAYLNTVSEVGDSDRTDRVRAVANSTLDEIRSRLRAVAQRAGSDPHVGDQFYALLAGGILLGVAFGNADPLTAARDAAVRLATGPASSG